MISFTVEQVAEKMAQFFVWLIHAVAKSREAVEAFPALQPCVNKKLQWSVLGFLL